MSNKPTPLPFSNTLRDLALLRVADLDFSSLLPPSNSPPTSTETTDSNEVETSVQGSYEFAKEVRAVIKINDRGDIEKEGARVENVRSKLEDVLQGLEHK